MEELEQQREALETSILQEQIEKPPITREQILFWFDQFRHGRRRILPFRKSHRLLCQLDLLFDDRHRGEFQLPGGRTPGSLEGT